MNAMELLSRWDETKPLWKIYTANEVKYLANYLKSGIKGRETKLFNRKKSAFVGDSKCDVLQQEIEGFSQKLKMINESINGWFKPGN